MDKMIFGSTAIKHYFPDYKHEPKDIDYIVKDKSKFKDTLKKEYFELPLLTFQEYINPDELYTLKISHSVRHLRNNKFHKHLSDIRFLKSKGCKLLPELLDKLLLFWDNYHGKRLIPDMDKPNDKFFNDKVNRKFNHDDLHNHFKFLKRPAYETIKYDLSKAKVEEELFEKSLLKEIIVLEELFVLTYERHKDNFFSDYYITYKNMFEALVTRLFPIYISVWCLDNVSRILNKENFLLFNILKDEFNSKLK